MMTIRCQHYSSSCQHSSNCQHSSSCQAHSNSNCCQACCGTLANLLQIFFAVSRTFDLDAFSMWGQIYVRCMGLENVPPPRFCLLVKLNLVHLPYARPYMLNGQRAFVGTVCKNNARMQKARPIAHTYTHDTCLKHRRFLCPCPPAANA